MTSSVLFLWLLMCAGRCAGEEAEHGHFGSLHLALSPNELDSPALIGPALELPGITVHGIPDPLLKSDAERGRLVNALPCLGCEVQLSTAPPQAVQMAGNLVKQALSSTLFHQPHIRREPNDEALYLAHEYLCTEDNPYGCLNNPKVP